MGLIKDSNRVCMNCAYQESLGTQEYVNKAVLAIVIPDVDVIYVCEQCNVKYLLEMHKMGFKDYGVSQGIDGKVRTFKSAGV